jgi:predicted RNA-binding Zn-ribbon protein involved in translation (DUF1610 family)
VLVFQPAPLLNWVVTPAGGGFVAHEWRQDARLEGRFRVDYPDHLQVIVHDGGPQVSGMEPEIVWVAVTGMSADLFWGHVLTHPHNLRTVREGDEIKFVMPTGDAPITFLVLAAVKLGLEKPPRTGWLAPLLVTDKYLRERESWIIHPCPQCGLTELFDAPSDLIRVLFPHHPAHVTASTFLAPCPNCGEALRVESRNSPAPGGAESGSAGDDSPGANATRLANSFLETGKLLVESLTAISELLGAITNDDAAEIALPTLHRATVRHNDLNNQLDSIQISMADHLQVAQARFQEYLTTTSDISISGAAAQMNAAVAQAKAPGKAKEIEAAMKKLGLA